MSTTSNDPNSNSSSHKRLDHRACDKPCSCTDGVRHPLQRTQSTFVLLFQRTQTRYRIPARLVNTVRAETVFSKLLVKTLLEARRCSHFSFKSSLGFGKLLGVDVCLLPPPLGIFAIEAPDAASRTPGKEHGSLPDLTPPFSQALHAGNFNGLRLISFLLRQQGIHLCLNSIALVRCMPCQCYGLLQDTKRLVALRQCRALRNQSRKLLLLLRSEATLRKLRSKRPERLAPL